MKCGTQKPGNYCVTANSVQIGPSTPRETPMENRVEPRMDANGREWTRMDANGREVVESHKLRCC